jgi:ubiquinone/menaquinone biosynthesis C-methylase UbiE
MNNLNPLHDPQKLAHQYKTASNLNARIQLHQRFSTNPYGWFRWVFDHFNIPSQGRILEIGCGPGVLWQENWARIPGGWDILLTDFSNGMLEQARLSLSRQPLAGSPRFRFEILDAQAVPFPYADATFDTVIANHMIYHVAEKPALFAEIRRLLKPAGYFYATTVGENHLHETADLIRRFDPQVAPWEGITASFTLENGRGQLSHWFEEVFMDRYEDALMVTEAEPLVEFLLSGFIDLPSERVLEFRDFVRQAVAASGGKFHITKDSGVFAAGGEK